MRKQLVAAVTGLMISAAALMPSAVSAWTPKAFAYTDNQSDASIWITVYGEPTNAIGLVGAIPSLFGQDLTSSEIKGTIQGAWCVAPHTFDRHGLSTRLYNVRGELMPPTSKGCTAAPRALNDVFWFAGDIPIDGKVASAGTYVQSTPQAQIKPGILKVTGGGPTGAKYAMYEYKGSSQ